MAFKKLGTTRPLLAAGFEDDLLSVLAVDHELIFNLVECLPPPVPSADSIATSLELYLFTVSTWRSLPPRAPMPKLQLRTTGWPIRMARADQRYPSLFDRVAESFSTVSQRCSLKRFAALQRQAIVQEIRVLVPGTDDHLNMEGCLHWSY